MPYVVRTLPCWAVLLAVSPPLAAADVAGAHPVVPGFERFFTGTPSDPSRGGRLLLGELNCVSCHQADAKLAEHLPRKQAPVLDAVGSRARRSFLRQFLSDPHAVKPGTTMPHVLAGLSEAERREAADALLHFLATTGTTLPQSRPDRKLIAAGRDIYNRIGCVACHGPRDAAGRPEGTPLATSVPLGDLTAKYSIPSLAGFLQDPHKLRPSGRMPGLLDAKDAPAVANYLLQGVEVSPAELNLSYRYYEGDWDMLPDFDRLEARGAGKSAGFDLGVARRPHNMALRFEGYLRIDREGSYKFHLTSDDGSKLFIDDELVVDNDGIHAPATKTKGKRLAPGLHKLVAGVFNGGGGVELAIEIESKDMPRQDVTSLVYATPDGKPTLPVKAVKSEDDPNFALDLTLAEKGRGLFASLGCASCHTLHFDRKAVSSKLTAPRLAELKPDAGCLAVSPDAKLPHYDLSAAQRTALNAALKSLKGPPAAAGPNEVIASTLLTFNCYACHERDKVGGVEEARNRYFVTTQQEMGDEGRVPPHLNGVGGKLKASWLKTILANGSKDRPYMLTKMPKFGEANVGKLLAAFTALDRVEPAPAVTFEQATGHVKATGRHLVGDQAFGCIKCHTFAGHKAEGVQGIDMTIMTQRLDRDWFFRYVLDPQAYRPGTRMPSAFPMGQSTLGTVLGGDANRQIEAIWLYLSEGNKAPIPAGLSKNLIVLEPARDAIIYRNFVEGAGPRAIAVGYPEKAHLAFDANQMRLAMIWQGAFIDASKHWHDRGAGNQGPLGDNVLHLPAGPSFARLASESDAWPTQPAREVGYQFQGYRLTKDQRPTFLYRFGPVRVEDFPNAAAGQPHPTLRRTLTLQASEPVDGLYFRAVVADKIEPLGDGWFKVQGEWKVRIGPAAEARVRSAGGKQELLVRVVFVDGRATVTEEFAW